MKYFMIFLYFVISAVLQHLTHESLHILVGKLCGLKLVSVQWLTYHGGTKVTFAGEEMLDMEGKKPLSWILMTLAGICGTTLAAYCFVTVFFLLPMGYLKLFFWVLSIIFLLTDSGYALLCALSGSGDLYIFCSSKRRQNIVRVITGCVFLFHCYLVHLLM